MIAFLMFIIVLAGLIKFTRGFARVFQIALLIVGALVVVA